MEEMTGQWEKPVFCNLIIEVVSFYLTVSYSLNTTFSVQQTVSAGF